MNKVNPITQSISKKLKLNIRLVVKINMLVVK